VQQRQQQHINKNNPEEKVGKKGTQKKKNKKTSPASIPAITCHNCLLCFRAE